MRATIERASNRPMGWATRVILLAPNAKTVGKQNRLEICIRIDSFRRSQWRSHLKIKSF